MSFLAYYIHQLSPYIVQFRPGFGLHWYGFAYVLSFLAGYQAYHYLAKRGYGELPPEKVADFITYAAIFGVMLGGRLGWIIFYGWDAVRAHPLNAFKLWEGGMASHGGILGLVIFTYVYARWHRISWPGVGDNLVVVAPIGLCIVRLANFVNGELWGRVITSSNPPPWAMRFPKEYEGSEMASALVEKAYQHDPQALEILSRILPLRHPSQIYEALLEGAVLFTVLWIVRTRFRAPVGMLTGIFLAGYAVLRIIGEQFREPDAGIGYTWGLTRGQILSVFFIFGGAAFIVYALRTKQYQLPGMRKTTAVPPTEKPFLTRVRRDAMSERQLFAAMLLAGGRSRRMGRDKALLPLPDGRLLWERQLAVLRALAPAELFISGSVRDGFPAEAAVLADETPGLGPLAGIVMGLRTMRSPRLVVLAIDLPALTAGFLRGLLDTAAEERGVVPQAADGFFEPLAAVYPRGALPLAETRLRGEDRSLQTFVRALIADDLAAAQPVADPESGLFVNWNRPEDLSY